MTFKQQIVMMKSNVTRSILCQTSLNILNCHWLVVACSSHCGDILSQTFNDACPPPSDIDYVVFPLPAGTVGVYRAWSMVSTAN